MNGTCAGIMAVAQISLRLEKVVDRCGFVYVYKKTIVLSMYCLSCECSCMLSSSYSLFEIYLLGLNCAIEINRT